MNHENYQGEEPSVAGLALVALSELDSRPDSGRNEKLALRRLSTKNDKVSVQRTNQASPSELK
jgi:hypothetical protein